MSAVPEFERNETARRVDDLAERRAPGGGVAARSNWPSAPWEFERTYQAFTRAEYDAFMAWVAANRHDAVIATDPDGVAQPCLIREVRAESLAATYWRCTLVLWALVPSQLETVPSIDATTIPAINGYELSSPPQTHPQANAADLCTLEHIQLHDPEAAVSLGPGSDPIRCYYQTADGTNRQLPTEPITYCPAGYTLVPGALCAPDNPKTCPVADPPYTLSADGLTCSRPVP